VRERELGSLRRVNDNYPKYLLTLDFITGDYEGIRQVNLIDWLLADAAQIPTLGSIYDKSQR
jgi:hypothetical protein